MHMFYAFLVCLLDTVPHQPEPWTSAQLLAPLRLAAIIEQDSTDQLVILSVGPGALIKGSIDMGPASEQRDLDKLKSFLSGKKRNEHFVIYCGCCPFEHCPNIRPAFNLLSQMGFTHHQLLNLTHNLKTDWIDHGYPIQELSK